jgi:hypothetical protein
MVAGDRHSFAMLARVLEFCIDIGRAVLEDGP